jgi:hypothetical protein
MGMYDTVCWKCPTCEAENETQSKAGECKFKNYRITSVPANVAADLIRNPGYCVSCQRTIQFDGEVKRVNLTPVDRQEQQFD